MATVNLSDQRETSSGQSRTSASQTAKGTVGKSNQSGTKKRPIRHSFSRNIAKAYGYKEAIVLQYIAYRVLNGSKCRAGTDWFFSTLDEIATHFPYFTRSAVNRAINRLKKKEVIVVDNFNRHKYDRTRWFTFKDREFKGLSFVKPAYFFVEDAEKYGVLEALLLHNLCYHSWSNLKKKPGYEWHRMSASEMAGLLNLPERSVRRALAHLVKEGVLESRPVDGWCRSLEYRVVNQELVERVVEEDDRPKWNVLRPKRNMDRPECNKQRPEWNNDTLLKDISLEDRFLENIQRANPTTSSSLDVCLLNLSPEGKNQTENATACPPALPGVAEQSQSSSFSDSREPNNRQSVQKSENVTVQATSGEAPGPLVDVSQETATNGTPSQNAPESIISNNSLLFPDACEIMPQSRSEAEIKKDEYYQLQQLKEDWKQREWLKQVERMEVYDNEDDPEYYESKLHPRKKVQLLRKWIESRNRCGLVDYENQMVDFGMLKCTRVGLTLALQFFEANPHIPVSKLTDQMEQLTRIEPLEPGEFDRKKFMCKAATILHIFFQNLDEITAHLSCWRSLPNMIIPKDLETEVLCNTEDNSQ